MLVQQILATLFVANLMVYFLEVSSLYRQMQKEYSDYWRAIGWPDISSPNGQMTFLAFVFGRKGYPDNFRQGLLRKCLRLRFYLVGGSVVFAVLVVVIHS